MPLSQIVSDSIQDGAVAPVDLSSVAQYYGFKNRLINGAMQFAQRGTTFTNLGASTPAYGLDRWAAWRGSYDTGLSASQQTGFNGFANCYRFGRAASNASTNAIFAAQIIESVNMLDLAGQTINVSFWGRNGANYSGSSFGVLISIGTATNQTLTPLTVASWTGFSNILNLQPTLTTTGAQYTGSVAVPSNAQSMAIQFYYTPTGTAGAADYIEITGVQIEKGSVATSFDYRPYGTELALCQRYYYKQQAVNTATVFGSGFNNAATNAVLLINFPVTMRTSPGALEQTGTAANYSVYYQGGSALACSSVPIFNTGDVWGATVLFTVASGLTAGQASMARANNTAAYLAWSAEL